MDPLPRIFVLSTPSILSIGEFEKIVGEEWSTSGGETAAESLVEFSGRVCYMSFGKRQSPKSNQQYIRHLIDQGHESVLEHVSWTFFIENISRALTHQLVRHRVGFSFSQLSQQYVDHSEVKFVAPPGLREGSKLFLEWKSECERATEVYRGLISESEFSNDREGLRARRSLARTILPNSVETKIVLTGNARAIRHFLDVRGSTLGDLEMRNFSAALYSAVVKEAPSIFADFEATVIEDGWPIVARRVHSPL